MKGSIYIIAVVLMIGFISACNTAKKSSLNTSGMSSFPGPKVIIYQTTKDYSQLVPVTLSADKKSLVSYPDVKDVFFNGELAYPTRLHKDFLLDNRGIDENVAFLNITYEAYSKLPKTPSAEELMKMILDSDPVSVMYKGGTKSSYSDIVKEMNNKIDEGDFSLMTKLK